LLTQRPSGRFPASLEFGARMPIPLLRLPSLDNLKGFVAVGRRMSITLAAQDLCLTQSAVSRQVQALEASLSVKLLVRGHRSLAFTPAGERLFRSADSALQQMQDVVGELKGSAGPQVVTVSASVGVTGLWLMPRLGGFIAAHPGIEVRLSACNRVVDLKAEGVDLALRYGRRHAMPEGAEHLFGETIVAVAHPSLGLSALREPAQLKRQVLLEFDGPYRPWLHWAAWIQAQGWPAVRPKAMLRFNQYDQIVHAAVAGQGIALGRRPLIDALLADGRLMALDAPQPVLAHEQGYWLIQADATPRAAVRQVADWIRAEVPASA